MTITFNEEMEIELAEFTTARRVIIPEKERLTHEDWRKLEERCIECCKENDTILSLSSIYAKDSIVL